MIAKYGNNDYSVSNNDCEVRKQLLQFQETIIAKEENNDCKERKQ
jgi:hypothetical protein